MCPSNSTILAGMKSMQKWFSKLSDPEDITQLKNPATMLKNSFDVKLGNGRLRTDLILVVLSLNSTNIADNNAAV